MRSPMRRWSRGAARAAHAGAGSRRGPYLAHVDRFRTLAAHDDGVHVVIAGGVVQDQRSAFGAGEPAVAPRRHGGEYPVRIASLVGEPVFVPRRVLLVLDPAH